LLFWFRRIQVRKANYVIITFLFFHLGIVEASSIDAGRSTCFQAIAVKAKGDQLFRYPVAAFSATLPPPNRFSPIWMTPLRKVPLVTTTAFAAIS